MGARINLAEIIAAAVVVAVGLGALWVSLDYPMGTVTRMGPGYVPVSLGVVLIVLGIAIAVVGRNSPRTRISASLRPFAMILTGMLVWALAVERVGFFAATAVLVAFCAAVEKGNTIVSYLVLAVVLCAAGYLIFVEGLRIPLPAFGK